MRFKVVVASLIFLHYVNVFASTSVDGSNKDEGISLSGTSSSIQRSDDLIWHAALDVVGHHPIKLQDKLSGTISTDWYEEMPGIKIRLNIIAKSHDFIQVVVFKEDANSILDTGLVALNVKNKIKERAIHLKSLFNNTKNKQIK